MRLENSGQKAALTTAIVAAAFAGVAIGNAQQTVPMGGVYVSGAGGSEWHDQQLFRNPTSQAISGKLYVVERSWRNHDNPGFSSVSSPGITINIPANSTLIIDDLYYTITGDEGAGAAWFVPDEGDSDPIWRSRVFNQLEDGQNGLTIAASTAEYSPAGMTLSDVLSGDSYRDGLFLESGPDGVQGYWFYRNSNGGNEVTIDQDLGPNKTFQWTGAAPQLLGFTPEPGAQLDYVIEAGSANAYLSRTNNDTNDGAFNKFEARETPSQSAYDIWMEIYVSDNGEGGLFATTSPSEEVIKRVWNLNTIDPLVGYSEWVCVDFPDSVVNSLGEVINNYNGLTWDEQNEFSGDRVAFQPFSNDSDNDGSPCDDDEPDHQFVYLIRMNIEPN